jgi:hypothetical protein
MGTIALHHYISGPSVPPPLLPTAATPPFLTTPHAWEANVLIFLRSWRFVRIIHGVYAAEHAVAEKELEAPPNPPLVAAPLSLVCLGRLLSPTNELFIRKT